MYFQTKPYCRCTRKHTWNLWQYPVLRYIFWIYLEPDWSWSFFKLGNKNASLNEWVTSSSKSLTWSNEIEISSKSSKQTKLPRVYNPKQCLQWRINFICNLKLFQAINRNYFDVTASLITIPHFINSDRTYSWKYWVKSYCAISKPGYKFSYCFVTWLFNQTNSNKKRKAFMMKVLSQYNHG